MKTPNKSVEFTVREFLDEFCDEACESVVIVNTDDRKHHNFEGKEIHNIPESLSSAKVKEYTLCYIPERMSHEICLYI